PPPTSTTSPALFHLSELGDVLRQLFLSLGGVLALHHHPDLLHHVGVGECRHVADITAVRDRCEHAAHDLPGARLRHVRHDVDVLGSCDLADHFFVRLDHAVHDVLARLHPGLDRDVHLGHASLQLVLDRHHGGLGDLRDCETGGLDLLRAEAVTGDVDHVVDAAEDAVIAICRLHRAVAAHEGPVAPVLAPGIRVVLGEIGLDVAVAVAPDRLHDARPRIADADVAGFAGALGNLGAGLVIDDRMNPRRGGAAAARLHRMNRRHGRAEKAAGFGHP